jgi:hypothetical protein
MSAPIYRIKCRQGVNGICNFMANGCRFAFFDTDLNEVCCRTDNLSCDADIEAYDTFSAWEMDET